MIDKIAEWLDWLRIDAAATTVESYGWELRHMERWSMPREVLTLSKSDLARYLAERRLSGCSDATIRRSVNALRAFYKFSLGKRSPAGTIPAPSVKKRRQRTLTADQAFGLMVSIDTSTALGWRNLALVCLCLSTGLRESELCHLRINELDLQSGRLTTRVKGGADGDGVFGSDTAATLATWLGVRSAIARPGVETVFVSIGGTKHGHPLTPSGLRVIFRRMGQKAGLKNSAGEPQRLSPHDLRRTCATLASRFGAPSRIVQIALRWNDPKMLELYTQGLTSADFAPYDPVSRMLRSNPEA